MVTHHANFGGIQAPSKQIILLQLYTAIDICEIAHYEAVFLYELWVPTASQHTTGQTSIFFSTEHGHVSKCWWLLSDELSRGIAHMLVLPHVPPITEMPPVLQLAAGSRWQFYSIMIWLLRRCCAGILGPEPNFESHRYTNEEESSWELISGAPWIWWNHVSVHRRVFVRFKCCILIKYSKYKL